MSARDWTTIVHARADMFHTACGITFHSHRTVGAHEWKSVSFEDRCSSCAVALANEEREKRVTITTRATPDDVRRAWKRGRK